MSEPQLQRTRVAAYALIVRDGQVLLSRLAPYLSLGELWTLPGGGIDFGEHPRDAVVREVREETGLHATVGERALIDSARRVTRDPNVPPTDMHSVRMIFQGAVPADSPEPHVVEVDGSTVDARWHPVVDVRRGAVPTVPMVQLALDADEAPRLQRTAAYGLAIDDDRVLLTRISATGHHPGAWTLPGGGVDHGEDPVETVRREFEEETGLVPEVGELLGVHTVHFTGTAPSGRTEDFHGIHLVYEVTASGEPNVREVGGTTDDARWLPLAAELEDGQGPELLDVAKAALGWRHGERTATGH